MADIDALMAPYPLLDQAVDKAVRGVAEGFRMSGASGPEADSMQAALKRFLVGDRDGARRALLRDFEPETADEILFEFDRGVVEGRAA